MGTETDRAYFLFLTVSCRVAPWAERQPAVRCICEDSISRENEKDSRRKRMAREETGDEERERRVLRGE